MCPALRHPSSLPPSTKSTLSFEFQELSSAGIRLQGHLRRRLCCCLALLLLLGLTTLARAQTITTVAGTGVAGYSGDGGSATAAQLNEPVGIATDREGNLYFAEWRNHSVRRVDVAGVITTVAGSGVAGFSGDGGPATAAKLDGPHFVFVDDAGKLYIAEFNHRIRVVDAQGIITTFAGTGVRGFSGDGGPATDAQLGIPHGLAMDSAGNLYIADYLNHRVRKVSPDGLITTVAGTGVWGFSGDGGAATDAELAGPTAIAVDAADTLYIADFLNDRVRTVDASGIITTLAGTGVRAFSGDGGPASEAQLALPSGVATDGLGNVYIANQIQHRVRKVDAEGIITTLAGTGVFGFSGDGGPASAAQLYLPFGVAVDGRHNVYISDRYNHRIRKVSVSPRQAITDLIALVRSFNLAHGTENSLVVKLENAQKSLDAGNTAAACGQIGAFVNAVEAQSGKKITPDHAQQILTAANEIATALGCP